MQVQTLTHRERRGDGREKSKEREKEQAIVVVMCVPALARVCADFDEGGRAGEEGPLRDRRINVEERETQKGRREGGGDDYTTKSNAQSCASTHKHTHTQIARV